MLLFIDSCGDHYNTANISRKWSYVESSWTVVSSGRTGNGLWGGNTGSDLRINLTKKFDSSNIMYMGIALFVPSFPTGELFGFRGLSGSNNSSSLWCQYESSGKLQVYRYKDTTLGSPILIAETPSNTIRLNTYHYIELKIVFTKANTGSVEIKVDGTTKASTGGINTIRNTDTSFSNYISNINFIANGYIMDDIYIADNSTSFSNTYLGDCKVLVLRCESNTAQQDWSYVGTSAVSAIYSIADQDNSYLYSSTANQKSTFNLENLPGDVTLVKGIQVCLGAKKTDASSRSIAPVLSNGSSEYIGANTYLWSDEHKYSLYSYGYNPIDDTSWDSTKINNLLLGVELTG